MWERGRASGGGGGGGDTDSDGTGGDHYSAKLMHDSETRLQNTRCPGEISYNSQLPSNEFRIWS